MEINEVKIKLKEQSIQHVLDFPSLSVPNSMEGLFKIFLLIRCNYRQYK